MPLLCSQQRLDGEDRKLSEYLNMYLLTESLEYSKCRNDNFWILNQKRRVIQEKMVSTKSLKPGDQFSTFGSFHQLKCSSWWYIRCFLKYRKDQRLCLISSDGNRRWYLDICGQEVVDASHFIVAAVCMLGSKPKFIYNLKEALLGYWDSSCQVQILLHCISLFLE